MPNAECGMPKAKIPGFGIWHSTLVIDSAFTLREQGTDMLTRRNVLMTLVVALGARMARGGQDPATSGPLPRQLPPTTVPTPSRADVMGSSIFDWNTLGVQKTKVGESRKVCQAPTATLDELECHITTLNPGETPHPPHQHPDEEIVIVKEGTVEALVNGVTRRVGPGSVIFQAANQMHSIRNVGDGPATYHVIKWNSPGMLKIKRGRA
jgi:XRE family transcriptional regulator, regulator of sulfur utilization